MHFLCVQIYQVKCLGLIIIQFSGLFFVCFRVFVFFLLVNRFFFAFANTVT